MKKQLTAVLTAALLLFSAVPMAAQSGVTYMSPTPTAIEGQYNRQCNDGYWTHAPIGTSGVCSDHGGLAVETSGGGCGRNCRDAAIGVGAGVLAVGIAIAIRRHKEQNRENTEFCQAYPNGNLNNGKSCAEWLSKHKK